MNTDNITPAQEDWITGEVPERCPYCSSEKSQGMEKKTVLTCIWWKYTCGTTIYDNRGFCEGKLTVRREAYCHRKSTPAPQVPTQGQSDEPLPCPFCGADPHVDNTVDFYSISCRSGSCCNPGTGSWVRPESALAEWNKRSSRQRAGAQTGGEEGAAIDRKTIQHLLRGIGHAQHELRKIIDEHFDEDPGCDGQECSSPGRELRDLIDHLEGTCIDDSGDYITARPLSTRPAMPATGGESEEEGLQEHCDQANAVFNEVVNNLTSDELRDLGVSAPPSGPLPVRTKAIAEARARIATYSKEQLAELDAIVQEYRAKGLPVEWTGETPETDAATFKVVGAEGDELCHASFARNLERQRNGARAMLDALLSHGKATDDALRAENARLRDDHCAEQEGKQ